MVSDPVNFELEGINVSLVIEVSLGLKVGTAHPPSLVPQRIRAFTAICCFHNSLFSGKQGGESFRYLVGPHNALPFVSLPESHN